MKILICGLPGSGKSTLAKELAYHFLLPHHNADTIRELYDDWDFSEAGRWRQALRMKDYYGILDFVCPTAYTRELVQALHPRKFVEICSDFENSKAYDYRAPTISTKSEFHAVHTFTVLLGTSYDT